MKIYVLLFLALMAVVASSHSSSSFSLDIRERNSSVGNPVYIKIQNSSHDNGIQNLNLDLIISDSGILYRYNGILENEINFTPTIPGIYEITLKNSTSIIDNLSFFVTDNTIPPRIENPIEFTDKRIIMSRDESRILSRNSQVIRSHKVEEHIYDVELRLGKNVKSIIFRNILMNGNATFDYEDIPPGNLPSREYVKAYAIDPSRMNFTEGEVTSTAKGNKLWKCKDYNFSGRYCYGNWTMLMDIVPGEEYTFTLTPEDPVFIETGFDADNCFNDYSSSFCSSEEVSAINKSDGTTKTFDSLSSPISISFGNNTKNMLKIQECTVHIVGFDDEGNNWTLETGNWSTRIFNSGAEVKIAPNPEGEITYNCASHFGKTDDDALFDDFAVRISTSDTLVPATSYIDYAYVTINYTENKSDIEVRNNWINISVIESEAIEGKNVFIYSIIKNNGNINITSNFTVQFFDGDPESDGMQIGGNKTVSSLPAGTNATLNVSWQVPGPGPRTVFIRADVPLSSNGTTIETNESNNEANRTFNFRAYQISYGNTTQRIMLGDSDERNMKNFTRKGNSSGNIYVTETGLDINFIALHALGRNLSNQTSSDDFFELDEALNMTSFQDSINRTWTNNGSPLFTRNFTIFSKGVDKVPVINSTNNSNFITGILWDSTDGGDEFNGTQDVVFVTKINQDKLGAHGIYDYEIKYPSRLTGYKNPSFSTLTFYYEIW